MTLENYSETKLSLKMNQVLSMIRKKAESLPQAPKRRVPERFPKRNAKPISVKGKNLPKGKVRTTTKKSKPAKVSAAKEEIRTSEKKRGKPRNVLVIKEPKVKKRVNSIPMQELVSLRSSLPRDLRPKLPAIRKKKSKSGHQPHQQSAPKEKLEFRLRYTTLPRVAMLKTNRFGGKKRITANLELGNFINRRKIVNRFKSMK
jgi:hypothetical protein